MAKKRSLEDMVKKIAKTPLDTSSSLDKNVKKIAKAKIVECISQIPETIDSYVKIAKGEYVIGHDVKVAKGGVLELEPGTKLLFHEKVGLDIFGTLIAKGNKDERIVFTAYKDKWRNILIEKDYSANTDFEEDSFLEYCKITHGTGRGQHSFGSMNYHGGGIMISRCDPTIKNCVIKNNSSSSGGGLYIEDSFAILENNIIEKNYATERGGGLTLRRGKMKLKNNIIKANTAVWEGGGVYMCGSNAVLSDNTITYNKASNKGSGSSGTGGGISMFSSGSILKNNKITNNTSKFSAGGVHIWSSVPTLEDNIIQNNKPDDIRRIPKQ